MNKKNSWDISKPIGLLVEAVVLDVLNRMPGSRIWIKNNEKDKRAPDIRIKDYEQYGDVKCAFTPYPTNKTVMAKNGLTPAGLTVHEHITLDMKDIEKYCDINLVYFIALANYEQTPAGIYCIHASTVKKIVESNPERKYTRSTRSFKDKIAKAGIAVSECSSLKLESETIERLKELGKL